MTSPPSSESGSAADRRESVRPITGADPAQSLPPHAASPLAVALGHGVDVGIGLSPEAVAERFAAYGPNAVAAAEKEPWAKTLLRQFRSLMVAILSVAAALAYALGEVADAVALLVVIAVNAAVGFAMERKALKSVDELKALVALRARVLRGGVEREVEAARLVPGDVLALSEGDIVGADARICVAGVLEVDESMLTGESVPVGKSTEPVPAATRVADRTGSVYAGTTVTRGSGRAIVVATGAGSEIGRIGAAASELSDAATPFERRLTALGRQLVAVTFALTGVVFVAGYATGVEVVTLVAVCVALAVAAVPEGLPVIATIALARGMLRLARGGVLVRKLASVETLGAADVLVVDKTGTLTENRMTVREVAWARDSDVDVGSGPDPASGAVSLSTPLRACMVLCNDASLAGEGLGDPLELALLEAVAREGVSVDRDIRTAHPRAESLPFDTRTRIMAVRCERAGSADLAYVKGAPEAVLAHCVGECDAAGELHRGIDRDAWATRVNDLSARGMRVLAFATARSETLTPLADLYLIAMVGLWDPPRADAAESIATLRGAGIRVVMATGDHVGTGVAIARAVGLTGERPPRATTSIRTPEEGGEAELAEVDLFARVDPHDKLALVRAYRERGLVVGMTGDGVNDVPALRQADIGLAVGARGTQAAREAADVILAGETLRGLMEAVREGRTVVANTRAFVLYLVSCNLAELAVVSLGFLLGVGLPLLPLQILFLNLVTDVFPALALGFTAASPSVLRGRPDATSATLLLARDWWAAGGYAAAIAAAVLGCYAFALSAGYDTGEARGLTFLTLVAAQLLQVFNLRRPDGSLGAAAVARNRYVWFALGTSVALTAAAYLWVPVARTLQLGAVDLCGFVIAVAFGVVPSLLIAAGKCLPRGVDRERWGSGSAGAVRH